MMEYTTIRGVEKPVPRIFFGTASQKFLEGEDRSDLLDGILAEGITAIDTARHYGKAEEVIGRWLKSRGNREKVVLLSKGGHPAGLKLHRIREKEIRKDIAASLSALGTDFIDIYLLHRDDPRRSVDESVEVLNALHAEGKIGAFGGSNWTHTRIEEANEYAYRKNLLPFTVSSPYFGLADMKGDPFLNGAVSISGPQKAEAREWYRKTGMPVIAFSALGRGFFSGNVHKPSDMKSWWRRGFATKENFERLARARALAEEKGCSVAQVALAWLLKQDLNGFAVVSASSIGYIRDDIAALGLELDERELSYLDLRDQTRP